MLKLLIIRLEKTRLQPITRNNGKSIVDLQLGIRKAARNCKFGTLLDNNLLKQIVAGVSCSALTMKLVEMAKVTTLAGAIQVITTFQLLERNMITAKSTVTNNDAIARLT